MSHERAVSATTTWLTPPHVLGSLGEFDLDPCAAPEPRPWPTAKTHYVLPTDGMAMPWFGRVWLNPPYGPVIEQWLNKLAEHGKGTALIFARTDTAWFHREVFEKASALLFLEGRIAFHHRDGTRAKNTGGAPSVLVAYGKEDANMLRKCSLGGRFIRLLPIVG